MKALIQRVSYASVTVDNRLVASIGLGMLILLGIEKGDSDQDAAFLATKCANLRIFEDARGKMNHSVMDVHGDILVVSQFTLCADCMRGSRPSFDNAERSEQAQILYNQFVTMLEEKGLRVASGVFGAFMQISLTNEGPVTLILESRRKLC